MTDDHLQYAMRQADIEDVSDVVSAIESLLGELQGIDGPDSIPGADQVCRDIIDGRQSGAVFVAHRIEDEGSLIGLAAATVQSAISYGGKYAQVQELWVSPGHRGDGVGKKLLEKLQNHFNRNGISIFRVCLPPLSFTDLERTHNFYLDCGYIDVGPYMKKTISR